MYSMMKFKVFNSFDSITITAKQLIILRPFQNFIQDKAIISQHRTIFFSFFRTVSSNMVYFKGSRIRELTLNTLRTQIVNNFFSKFYSLQKTSSRKNSKLFFLIHWMRLPEIVHPLRHSGFPFLLTTNFRASCRTRRPFPSFSTVKFFTTNFTNSFQVKPSTLKKSSKSFISIAIKHLDRSITNTTSITKKDMERNL